MAQMYPYPPLPDASTQAALQVKAGDWLTACTWGFLFYHFWQGIEIDGVRYSLQYATPTLIPVSPGYHKVTCFQYQPFAHLKGKPQNRNSRELEVAPGSVQPLLYRMHRTCLGTLTNLKTTVLKVGVPGPLQIRVASQPETVPARFDSPFTDERQAQPPAPQFAAKRFCTQCGAEVIAGNRYCGGCGQGLVA